MLDCSKDECNKAIAMYVILAVLFFAGLSYLCFSSGGKSSTELRSSTDREVGAVEAQQQSVSDGIDRASVTSTEIKESISDTSERIERSEESARVIAGEVDSIIERVGKCKALAEENSRIISESEKEYRFRER